MSEWIRVQEKMPPNTVAVLVWCPERRNIYTSTWRAPFWYHFADVGDQMRQLVTHWMPLPSPPSQVPAIPADKDSQHPKAEP